jgi:hypothetical protein
MPSYPPGNDPHPAKILDLEMLIAPVASNVPSPSLKKLLADSGFRINRIVPTRSPVSIVEASKLRLERMRPLAIPPERGGICPLDTSSPDKTPPF